MIAAFTFKAPASWPPTTISLKFSTWYRIHLLHAAEDHWLHVPLLSSQKPNSSTSPAPDWADESTQHSVNHSQSTLKHFNSVDEETQDHLCSWTVGRGCPDARWSWHPTLKSTSLTTINSRRTLFKGEIEIVKIRRTCIQHSHITHSLLITWTARLWVAAVCPRWLTESSILGKCLCLTLTTFTAIHSFERLEGDLSLLWDFAVGGCGLIFQTQAAILSFDFDCLNVVVLQTHQNLQKLPHVDLIIRLLNRTSHSHHPNHFHQKLMVVLSLRTRLWLLPKPCWKCEVS